MTDVDDVPTVRGDESLPWRRPKPTKMRSRSLQPGAERSIENLPWLRQRDRSFSRQEQPMLYGRDKHPIRPWIEEVICLKRTELRRKIIEKAELEKVLLKASQIERKEIIRAQIIEHIDLKSVQKYFERGNFANIEEAQVAMEEELIQQFEEDTKLQHVKHEDELSILELTQQIDALVRKDYEQKSNTVERVSSKQIQQEEQLSHSTFSAVEDSSILKLDRHDELEMQLIRDKQIGVPWARGLRKNLQEKTHQPVSHLEDSTYLSIEKSVDETQHLQKQQDVAVGWARGPKTSATTLSHTEDTTILSMDKSVNIESTQIKDQTQETAVAWQRGRKPTRDVSTIKTTTITHKDDSSILRVDVNQQDEIKLEETPVAWRRGGRKEQPQSQQVQHTENTTILDVSAHETVDVKPAEIAVPWLRGQKKTKPEPIVQHIQHTEDSSISNVGKTTEEVAVPWLRSKKSKPVEEPLDDVPIAWERGKKNKPVPSEESYSADEVTPVIRQPIIESGNVPWVRGQKPVPSSINTPEVKQRPTGKRRPKQNEEAEQVLLKPIPRKDIPKKEIRPEQELDETPKVWVRGEKKLPKDKTVEEKSWPTGKQRPQPEEELEQIQLKAIPKPDKPQIEDVDDKLWPIVKQQPKEPELAEPVHIRPISQNTLQTEKVSLEPNVVVLEVPNTYTPEPEPKEVEDIMIQKIIKRNIPRDRRRPSLKAASVDIEEVLPEQVDEIVSILLPEEQLHEDVVELEVIQLTTDVIHPTTEQVKIKKTSKKKLKPRKPIESAQSVDEEEYTVLENNDVILSHPIESIVPETVTDKANIADIPTPFLLTEVKEDLDVVEKIKVQVSRTNQPEEITENLLNVQETVKLSEKIEVPETLETATVAEEVIVEKKPDKMKKKTTKRTKQVMFNDKLETFEAEAIEEDSSDEVLIEEVSSTLMQLHPITPITPTAQPQQIEELVVEEHEIEMYRKDMDVKTMSQVIKKERRQIVIDDSHPLPELELISQKRVQKVVDKVTDEENFVMDITDELISHTTIPGTIVKPVVKAPRFLKKLQPALCQPDAPTILQCKIDGAPYPEVKWYFNDIELFASEKFIFNVTEKVVTLKIASVTAKDVGIYTCQAINEAGVATSRTNLILGKYFFCC